MKHSTTLTVRIGGPLSDFVASQVGDAGTFDNVSEYVRDLIRRDKERLEREAVDRLKAELTTAFAAPDERYKPLTAEMIVSRNKERIG